MSKMPLLYSFNFTAEGCYDILFEGFEEYKDMFIRFNELWYLKKCKMSVNSPLQVNFCKLIFISGNFPDDMKRE